MKTDHEIQEFLKDFDKAKNGCLILFLIPMQKIPNSKLQLSINFGFSSKGSDLDNPLKQTIDILSKKLGFNDNMIYKLIITKEIVSKGNDYFEYKIEKID